MEIPIHEYVKNRKRTWTEIESPDEIKKEILGLKLTGFEVLTEDDAFCGEEEEICLRFGGKEMRIYINDKGKLAVYTD